MMSGKKVYASSKDHTPPPLPNMDMEDNLQVFNSDDFDADSYLLSNSHSLAEKDIRELCSYLVDLKRASADEIRRTVYANYTAFIQASKEITDLEGELLTIKNLLSTQATLIHNLADGVCIDSLAITAHDGPVLDTSSIHDNKDYSDLEKRLLEFPDVLDVLLAERRIDEALETLDMAEHFVSKPKEGNLLSPAVLLSLQISVSDCRQKLADQLAETACQPCTDGSELRAAISALKKLGDGPRAHTLLLNAHNQRCLSNMQTLRPPSNSYSGAYIAALSQAIFSAISQAANDSLSIFGNEPAYTSELVVWATKQIEEFVLIVKRRALASSAAAGGLRAATECVKIALGHCSLLESQGLALSHVLLKLFRPGVEQAVEASLKHIEDTTAAVAAADDWELTLPQSVMRQSGRFPSATTAAYQLKLSSSAHKFSLMVQDFLEDVGPLLSMQLRNKTLDGLLHLFNSYVNILIKALPGSMEDEEANYDGSTNIIVQIAENEAQQIAMLANASLLADELLSCGAMKLALLNQTIQEEDLRRGLLDRQNRYPELKEWRRHLMSSVDRLKDSFCRHHALVLILTEEGDSKFSADMYINMEGNPYEIEWIPSPIFRELYAKISRIASIASDMFVGRERFATLLLVRLTETVVLWLSEDQSFWDDMEEGPRPLGLIGLQQFYLDMKFIMWFSSQGRYLSRNLNRIVNDIISKGLAAFASTGIDPYSYLPEDEWFTNVCQGALNKFSGEPKLANGDQALNSPTPVSAQSISPIRSHGSD